jgi:hypothetical protein
MERICADLAPAVRAASLSSRISAAVASSHGEAGCISCAAPCAARRSGGRGPRTKRASQRDVAADAEAAAEATPYCLLDHGDTEQVVVGQGGSVRVFGYSGAQNTYKVSVP